MEIGKGWNGQRAEWRGSLCRSDDRITVGVCAREKKARSKHMEAITSQLPSEKFEVGHPHAVLLDFFSVVVSLRRIVPLSSLGLW